MVAVERRFLVDGSMAQGGGGFTYLVNIVPKLAQMAPNDRFRILVRTQRLADSLPNLPNVEIEQLPEAGVVDRLRFTYREAPRLAERWGADLYFSVAEYAPLRASCPIIAAFRNPNVFTKLKQGWPIKQRLRLGMLRAMAGLSVRASDRIMFVSDDSADWIGDVAGVAPERRATIHHGIDPAAWKSRSGANPHGRPFILSVSSIYRYKNFVPLIEAWAELARRVPGTPDLVIIGDDQDPDYSARMQAARDATGALADRVHVLGEVPYADVRRYYAHASLFVFPSYLETFGHPLLEAMASEVPLVAADIPVFREIAGDAAFYSDPHSSRSMADARDTDQARPRAREGVQLGSLRRATSQHVRSRARGAQRGGQCLDAREAARTTRRDERRLISLARTAM